MFKVRATSLIKGNGENFISKVAYADSLEN
jgi:hypothetical protein